MKIATWNINSIKVRLPQILQWLSEHQPDILALQETKTIDENFPKAAIEAVGYQVIFAGQKSYNGVAVITRHLPQNVITDIPDLLDPQRRILVASVADYRIINLYVPNGESLLSEKYTYKLSWLAKVKNYLQQQLKEHPHVVMLGDFNIAPETIDVHDPAIWSDGVLVSEPERAVFKEFLSLGLNDCFRLFEKSSGHFSWWDYRAASFRRNLGLRIDHILASESIAKKCVSCIIDKNPRKNEQPSDHAPVLAEFL